MLPELALVLLPLAGCTADGSTGIEIETEPSAAVAGRVLDLDVESVGDSTVTLSWTQVDDGRGNPADYRVKYGRPPIEWRSASVGCDHSLEGDAVGATMSCTVEGLDPATAYEFQMMSYRLVSGRWRGAVYSNTIAAKTSEAGASEPDPDEPSPDEPGVDPDAGAVSDLAIVDRTRTSLTLEWTQVDDGTGTPAWYRVKYALPTIDWSTATVGCDASLKGDAIGARFTCTVEGLSDDTTYEVQLMSYRSVEGVWQGSVYSNVATGTTDAVETIDVAGPGIWIDRNRLAALPMSGPAWSNLLDEASGSCGLMDLTDQDQDHNVCLMAKALVAARTGDPARKLDVAAALNAVVLAPVYTGRALALGRELGTYVIAADLIDLGAVNPVLDAAFRTAIRALLTANTVSGPSNLVDCHEVRPNNWGTHCGGTRAAIAAYLGDDAELARVAQVFKGWLGDRASYAGFKYGDLSWQCDPDRPVGINPAGCVRDGHVLDGVIADDQRRGGGFVWPAPRENYVWEALQGALVQAVILERAGYPAFEWEDRALLRAALWLHQENDYPAEGDDEWQPYVLNHFYGTDFPTQTSARAGKNVGWTDWTHG